MLDIEEWIEMWITNYKLQIKDNKLDTNKCSILIVYAT